ncbi:MAG TPA: Fic family protein [Candidatus Bathyarchaeia archaeon]|nr:Fic family protein [Candidatus Bathyarchaeia archaeon]
MILDQSIYQRIIEKKRKLESLRPLPKLLVNRLKEQIIVEWTYNSNAIEGTSLSLKETELIIEHGLTIKGKPLKEHFEAINHKDAILFLEDLIEKGKFKLNELLIRQIHQLILKEIDKDNAGKYRKVDVKITGTKFIPPNPAVVSIKMRNFENWLKNRKNQKQIIDYASLAHFKLVDIHPFIDGNGRTARLLMNLILMNKGFPPTVILKTDRQKYYQTLDFAHKGELKLFVDFIGRSVERSLTWYLDAVMPTKRKKQESKWKLLSQLAPLTPYSQEYLSLLARRRRIEAIKKERNWYSNLKAIKDYMRKISRK